MKGRKPKPTHLKLLEGNPGKRKLNDAEPKFAVSGKDSRITKPALLTGAAAEEWKRMLPILESSRVLTHADRTALASYCYWFGVWKECAEELKKTGRTVPTQRGMTAHPLVKQVKDASLMVARFASELGMTPSSRSRLRVEPRDEKDELEKLLTSKS